MREFNLILMFCLYGVISLKANTAIDIERCIGITQDKVAEEIVFMSKSEAIKEETTTLIS